MGRASTIRATNSRWHEVARLVPPYRWSPDRRVLPGVPPAVGLACVFRARHHPTNSKLMAYRQPHAPARQLAAPQAIRAGLETSGTAEMIRLLTRVAMAPVLRYRVARSWWMATPPTMSATPATSDNVGNWRSTTTPMMVAQAGSAESSSAKVARDSRAIAN